MDSSDQKMPVQKMPVYASFGSTAPVPNTEMTKLANTVQQCQELAGAVLNRLGQLESVLFGERPPASEKTKAATLVRSGAVGELSGALDELHDTLARIGGVVEALRKLA